MYLLRDNSHRWREIGGTLTAIFSRNLLTWSNGFVSAWSGRLRRTSRRTSGNASKMRSSRVVAWTKVSLRRPTLKMPSERYQLSILTGKGLLYFSSIILFFTPERYLLSCVRVSTLRQIQGFTNFYEAHFLWPNIDVTMEINNNDKKRRMNRGFKDLNKFIKVC